MGRTLYGQSCIDEALESIEIANEIDPTSKELRLVWSIIKSEQHRKQINIGSIGPPSFPSPISNPFITNRSVEKDLIACLYRMRYQELDKTVDARFGKGKCSPDFSLFDVTTPVIENVAASLKEIMMDALNAEIYIFDSFFNIMSAGGGTTPHHHLQPIDKDPVLDISPQKYSLVYYLDAGDQKCSQPGILKLYNPDEDILPCEGMIVIIPAERMHSAVYDGRRDRIMIGVNFYVLDGPLLSNF